MFCSSFGTHLNFSVSTTYILQDQCSLKTAILELLELKGVWVSKAKKHSDWDRDNSKHISLSHISLTQTQTHPTFLGWKKKNHTTFPQTTTATSGGSGNQWPITAHFKLFLPIAVCPFSSLVSPSLCFPYLFLFPQLSHPPPPTEVDTFWIVKDCEDTPTRSASKLDLPFGPGDSIFVCHWKNRPKGWCFQCKVCFGEKKCAGKP